MGKFLSRLTGNSLQIGSGSFFKNIRPAGVTGFKLPGTVQQMLFDARTSVKDMVDKTVGTEGILATGLVSNIIPSIRATRVVPPPATPPATSNETGVRTGYRGMQVPYEDVQALDSLQFDDPREVEALGDGVPVYVN